MRVGVKFLTYFFVQLQNYFMHLRRWAIENPLQLRRNLALLALLVICLYFVPRVVVGNHTIPLMLVGGMIAVIGASLIIRFPTLAFILMIPVAMVVPFGLGTGTETTLNGAVLIVLAMLALWVLGMIVRKNVRLFGSSATAPALLLPVTAVIAFVIGQLPWFYTAHVSLGAQIGGVLIYVLSASCLLVVAHMLTPRGLLWMVWIFLALATIFIIARWQSELLRPVVDRFLNGAIGSVFWIWLLMLSLGQLLFNTKLNIAVRAWLIVLVGLTLWVMLVQGKEWVSGWMPPLFGAAVMIWINWRKLRVPLLLLGMLIIFLQWATLRGMVMVGDNEYSLVTRTAAWKILFQIIAANPITGVGPSNYYVYTTLFPIMGYSVSFNSHNQYVDLLAQTGILGLGVFTWLMVALQRLSWKLSVLLPSGFMRGFIVASGGAVAGTILCGMLGDWVLPFVYNVGYDGLRASLIGWAFLGAVVAVERWIQNHEVETIASERIALESKG